MSQPSPAPALVPLRIPRGGVGRELARALEGEVRFDDTSRALYASDASNYRQTPIGVVIPRSLDDIVATIEICRRHGLPILSRGGGTSLAGQCCNTAVVIDWSKYLGRILDIDPVGRTATVLPGTVLDALRREASERFRLTLGPDPSTHDRCTIGGMIGNDSCGAHSQMAGTMAENVEALEILTYDGLRMWVGRTSAQELAAILEAGGRRAEIYRGLLSLREAHGDRIRERFPRIPRRVSGYNLDALLPENGFDVARALTGTEGTCVTVLQAKVRLVDAPPNRALLAVAYPDIFEAADRVHELERFDLLALEAMDEGLIERVRRRGIHPDALEALPRGGGILLLELGGWSHAEAVEKAAAVQAQLRDGRISSKIFDDPKEQERIWTIRASGLGVTARSPGRPDTFEGWEDAAVSPARLGAYLRDYRRLLDAHGFDAALYGHFGQGCVHCRIDFDFESEEGRARFRVFVEDAADLVVSHGGSLSGEHGDGQARAELLPKMFGDELVQAFNAFKALWDPARKMNPGKVVYPHRLDEDLRLARPRSHPPTHFRFPEDEGRIDRAAARCVGVGLCRRQEGGLMCPSYKVTREEMHSTRGRARLLFELLQGETLKDGWRDRGAREALDLCLACKGCKGECPVNVDVATFKAEFLSHHYRGRLRPRPAYALGLVMVWMRLARLAPWLANGLLQSEALGPLARWMGDIDPRRAIPRIAPRSFQQRLALRRAFAPPRSRQRRGEPGAGAGKRVVLWPDTFNNHFHPESAEAAVEVLERAGYRVEVPRAAVCCGRPLYDFGMLETAKRFLRRTLRQLEPYVVAGVPIVGLEPSCVSVFHDELPNLFPDDPRARALRSLFTSFGSFLEKEGIEVPRLEVEAIVQAHCHAQALGEVGGDRAVMERMGLRYQIPDSGCCGLAGAFGYEAGLKYEVAQACGEAVILPKVRAAGSDTLLIADGFSCRSQIEDGTGRAPLHLAEVVRFAMERKAWILG